MQEMVTLILAAGKGTRMKSDKPKVLHWVGGKPMLAHVVEAARAIGASRTIAVVGFGGEQVQLEMGDGLEYAIQSEQLGTGHAVMQAQPILADFSGTVLVLCGDTPLLTTGTLQKLCNAHRDAGAAATVLTARLDNPAGYGRILRDDAGGVVGIVEQKMHRPSNSRLMKLIQGYTVLSPLPCSMH